MPLSLAFGCTTPPPKTTTLAHANGLNPSATNILTFLSKECEDSAKVSVFMRISEQESVTAGSATDTSELWNRRVSAGPCANPRPL